MRKTAQALRWAWAGLGLGLSPLYFMQAPSISLFKLQLGLTEFGHWLAVPSLLLALWPTKKAKLARGLCALAIFLYLGPALRAWALAPSLERSTEAAWPVTPSAPTPAFSWSRLFRDDPPGPSVQSEDKVFDAANGLSLTCWQVSSSVPVSGPGRPFVLVIYGGGWDNGQRDDFPDWDVALAREGYVVLDVDYRLAPAHPWPAQREDIQHALQCAHDNAKAWNLDPTRGALLGRSAGAQLALATAYLQTSGPAAIKAVASFYGPADLFFAYQYGKPDDILASLDLLKNFCAGTPESAKAAYQEASPYFHVSSNTPPTLLIHGDIDALVWSKQSERLNAVLQSAGRPHQFVELPWATHAFDYNFKGPSGQLAWYALQRFLASTLTAPQQKTGRPHGRPVIDPPPL